MDLKALIGIPLFIILFFITLIRVIVWSCVYKLQTHIINEKDIAKAVLQMSDGSPEKYFELLVTLYENIYDDCTECEMICQCIVQTLQHAKEVHQPSSFEEIEDILKQIILGFKMTGLQDFPITGELLLTLQDEHRIPLEHQKEKLKWSTVWWSWSCTIFGGALNKCPQNKSSILYHPFGSQNVRSTKYNAMIQNSKDFTAYNLWFIASTKRSNKRNTPKKGNKSQPKRKMVKK